MKQDLSPRARFRITEFENPSGGKVWRVSGIQRDGTRVRENFRDPLVAQARATELESQWLGLQQLATLRPTHLSIPELRLAESAFARLEDPAELTKAVDHWLSHARKVALHKSNVPTLDDAWKAYDAWLDLATCPLRAKTKPTIKSFMASFVAESANVRVDQLTPESIEATLVKRWPGAVTRNNVRRVISRFCTWCMERSRRWLSSNPATTALIPIEEGESGEPEIFSLAQVRRLLVAARRFRGGKFLRFVVLGLFGGLRPAEAIRVRAGQVNLDDGELRLEGAQTKTGDPRTVFLHPTAVAWLRLCPGATRDPQKSRLLWDELRKKARCLEKWPHDVLRHTAISHAFRLEGSYGRVAEWAGNSEAIIKKHYQGRVSSEETAVFWALHPDRHERLLARAKMAEAKAGRVVVLSRESFLERARTARG
jgi:integrase